MEKYSIHDVFTPTRPATITFVERDTINDALVDALSTPGKQIVVYGHSGSGKTTLLVNKLHQLFEAHLTTRCMVGLKFEHLMVDAFDQPDGFYDAERTSKTGTKISSGLSADYFGIKAKIGADISSDSEVKQVRILPPQLSPQRLAQFIGEANCCWVLEDFHKLEVAEKKRLSQVMKIFMDMAATYRNLKIIAIGAVGTAREIVEYDAEMKNRVAEIGVPLMSDDELSQILAKGEQLLKLRFDEKIKDAIVASSNGLASVCHQLGLNCCIAGGIRETVGQVRPITSKEFDIAVTDYVTAESDSIRAALDRAVRRERERKYDNCRIILQAIAEDDSEDGMTTAEILQKIHKRTPKYPASNLSKYLVELQLDTRGAVIRRDSASGKCAFANPFHKVYAQMVFSRGRKEKVQIEFKLQDALSEETKNKLIQLIADAAISFLKAPG